MMNIKCPNKTLPEWKELVEAVGENSAYYLWDQNNGYGLDRAPNGAPSKLFSDLLSHYNGDRNTAIAAKAKVYSEAFKNWFGDWVNASNVTSSPKQDNDAIDYLFSMNPQLEQIGTREEYQQYINSIFPDSQVDSVYWHGTDSDFNQGLENATRGKGSGAPETKGEMYFNKQPWASLQYISGVNRNITDKNGFNNWVKLWWELKEILGNGRLQNDDWKNLVIGPDVRQEIPNKRGIFNRNQGGSNGKYLRERKADYGYENKSDKEFFEEVFGIKYGKDTFQDWVDRNTDKFKQIWNSRSVKKGIYPAILNVQNPIVEEGQNTYYEEQRGLMTRAKRDGNDAIISNKAKNEFGSDVIVMLNPQQDVHILGTNQDLEQFKQWKQHNNVSKVVDENGEPLLSSVVSNQGLLQWLQNNPIQITPTTFDPSIIRQISDTYEHIQKGLKDRLKSVKRYSTKNPRLWNQLSTVISQLANSEAEQGILQFLQHISDTINDAIKFLQKPIDEINAKQIRQLSQDYVGFYKPLLDDIIYLFDTTDIFKDLPNYAELQRNAQRLSTEMDQVYNRFVHLLKAKGISELVSYLQSNNVPQSYIDKTLEWLNNPTNDISIFLNWFGMASNSNSMVTQAIAKMLNDTMNQTQRETMSKGIELVKLAQAAKEKYGVDVQKLLYEKLNDGTYSGYRVRPINYGQYKKDKQQYLDKLANKLGITKDKEGHYNLPNDEATQKKWFDGINKFYSERVNRRFTSEYYTTRNRMLSVKTREAIDEIQDYIDSIVSRVTIDGVQHDELLTQSEYQQLLTLRRQKQLLANEYNLDGSIKTGDDLIIADELSAFNEEVNKNVRREVDWDGYNRDHKKIVDQYGKDDPRTKLWEARNTTERYTDEFYERLDRLNDVEQSELYDDLVYKRRQLRQLFKDPETKQIKAGDLTDEQKAMLLQLDKDIAASRYIEQRNPDELEDSFKKFAEVVYTDEYYRDYREAHDAGTTWFQQWYEANHYEDAYGRMRPASYYTKLKPKDEVADKYTETVPTGRYTKIDPTSNWYNPDYDNNGPAIQPKKEFYDNSKAYNEVMSKPEVKALYEAIVDTMNQANSYIPFLNMADDGRMSQMPARYAQVWARTSGITDRLKYSVSRVISTQEDDFDYVDEFTTMPNGDPIKVLPTRFIRMLDNPNAISTDAVTATIAYYNMAVNFKNMQERQDDIELMLGLLKNITIRNRKGTVQPGNSNLYKQAQLLVDRLLYGRNVNKVTANIFGREINITKMALLLLDQIRKVNLSGNIWSIGTSFFTDSTYTTLEAKLGRYFDKEDLQFAVKEYARRLPNIMENIGNPVPNDKLSYLMLLNQVVRDNRKVFDRIDQSQVLRSINNNFWYLGYTQSDYLVKSHTLMSVYHNYRLVDGKFMSKAEFINTYYPSNKKAGEAAFKQLEITAFDAYNEDGTVKEEYKSKVTTKLMNDIKNRIDVLSRRIDGTLREVDKAQIHANFLGQYVIMHKNFMIQGLHDRFKKKQFNLDTQMEEDGYYRSMSRFLRNIIGNRHFGLTQLLADYNQLQEYEQYAVRRVLHEITLFTSATLLALSLAALVDGDDDYDNWLMQSLTYLALRSAFEFRTMYNPMEFFSLIKSPTAAFTWFDNASAFINLFNPFSYIGSGGPFAIIDRGVYEGMPRVLRNIIKVTPIRSIIEAGDPESKRSYLQNQLMSF